jgi:hypothetical protein
MPEKHKQEDGKDDHADHERKTGHELISAARHEAVKPDNGVCPWLGGGRR